MALRRKICVKTHANALGIKMFSVLLKSLVFWVHNGIRTKNQKCENLKKCTKSLEVTISFHQPKRMVTFVAQTCFFVQYICTISKEESTLKFTFFSPHHFVKINTFLCSIFILALMAKHFSFLCFPDKCSLQSNCYLGEE